MIHIAVPDICTNEIRYTIGVIFEEFWQVQCSVSNHSRKEFIIRCGAIDTPIKLASDFFQSADSNWLEKKSLIYNENTRLNLTEYGLDRKLPFSDLPVVFGKPEMSISKDQIHLGFDVFGTIFFMLSRYEEYFCFDNDTHQRFQVENSLAFKNGFLDRPIVNEYLELLWFLISALDPTLNRMRRTFKIKVTCDLDRPFNPAFDSFIYAVKDGLSYLKNSGTVAPILRNLVDFFGTRRLRVDQNTVGIFWMMDQCEARNLDLDFYVIPLATMPNDCFYDIDSEEMRALIEEIISRGHGVGMHPGYFCFKDEELFRSSVSKFNVLRAKYFQDSTLSNRMHYLRWAYPETLQLCQSSGVSIDSSMAFAGKAGFRSGTCFEYPMYDVSTRNKTSVTQRPLILMESTIIEEQYEGLGYSELAVGRALQLREQCQIYNGNFVFLWHNCHLESLLDRDFFERLIEV